MTLLAPGEAVPEVALEQAQQNDEGQWTVRLATPGGTHRLMLGGSSRLATVEHRSPAGEETRLQIEVP